MKFYIFILALILLSCSLKDGEYIVSSEHFVPQHYYIWYSHVATGKYSSISIPHTAHVDDAWVLELKNTKNNDTEEVQVSHTMYDHIKVGTLVEVRNDSIFVK